MPHSIITRSFPKHSSEPINYLGTEETKPKTTKPNMHQ